MDGEEDIGRVRVGHRRLKKVKKIQFHLGGMKLNYIARLLASPTAPATIKAVAMCPRKDIEEAVGHVSLKPTVVAAGL